MTNYIKTIRFKSKELCENNSILIKWNCLNCGKTNNGLNLFSNYRNRKIIPVMCHYCEFNFNLKLTNPNKL